MDSRMKIFSSYEKALTVHVLCRRLPWGIVILPRFTEMCEYICVD